jgi:cysteine desulfurase
MAHSPRASPGGVTIYLDYQATTPLAPEAAAAMRPWLDEKFANPHSSHKLGREAAAAVEVARGQIMAAMGAKDGRLVFTSGATEALNWAIKGSFSQADSGRRRIVTTATEHAAVLDSIDWLKGKGADVVILPVDHDGLIDKKQALTAIDERTALVAIMNVNNEIGVVQHSRLVDIAKKTRSVGAPLICDNVQGFARMLSPIGECDMMAISAHKIHGPKAIGALWIRDGFTPEPLLHGGGQEAGLRSGTLAPALCVGFGAAAALMRENQADEEEHVYRLYERLRAKFGQDWHVNGSRSFRWRGNLNIRHENIDAARLISEVRGVAFSAGAACASGSGRPSHVLRAIGLTDKQARGSIRLGFGRYTTIEEIDAAADMILAAAERQL